MIKADVNSSIAQERALGAIVQERVYQAGKWPSMNAAKVGEELLLLEQLVMEARISWAAEKAPERGALKIIRKIAAVATRCMENNGVELRE